jgi:hypothetical protein
MKTFKKILKVLFIILLLLTIFYTLFVLITRPSATRDWVADQTVVAQSAFDGDLVHIKNIRNNKYRTTTDFDIRYYDKTFDLNKINSVWYMIEPFSGQKQGTAHTLLSFGFDDGSYVSISVEIRKEKGEAFSVLKGLFRQYELIYTVADERDVIKLRSNYRKDEVFLYPVNASKEKIRELFVSMLTRTNKLAIEPEFYNTLTSNCTTNIVAHVNEISPKKVPFSFKVVMPAYSDELAQQIGLIDNSISLEEIRAKYKINERAEKYTDSPDFSKSIRE